MPTVILHRDGQTYQGEIRENTNLVVRAGIKQFPHPNLRYGCGMGKCAKCACRVLAGADLLPEPNWKERKQLGPRLEQGYRLVCQLWLNHDIELAQDKDPLPPLVQATP
ncbi:MAG: 2Fe-2S iron-sulfur cluster-binding protein [Pseudomonadota bacterium]